MSRFFKFLMNEPIAKSEIVIPAEAGIQSFQEFLAPRFRGGDAIF
jgi:hypothetical protein